MTLSTKELNLIATTIVEAHISAERYFSLRLPPDFRNNLDRNLLQSALYGEEDKTCVYQSALDAVNMFYLNGPELEYEKVEPSSPTDFSNLMDRYLDGCAVSWHPFCVGLKAYNDKLKQAIKQVNGNHD